MKVRELDLKKRIWKALENEGIDEVEDLVNLTYDDLRYDLGFGQKAITDIENALDIEGLSLKEP